MRRRHLGHAEAAAQGLKLVPDRPWRDPALHASVDELLDSGAVDGDDEPLGTPARQAVTGILRPARHGGPRVRHPAVVGVPDATHTIATDARTADEVAAELEALLKNGG